MAGDEEGGCQLDRSCRAVPLPFQRILERLAVGLATAKRQPVGGSDGSGRAAVRARCQPPGAPVGHDGVMQGSAARHRLWRA
jgi:hypothetical protein